MTNKTISILFFFLVVFSFSSFSQEKPFDEFSEFRSLKKVSVSGTVFQLEQGTFEFTANSKGVFVRSLDNEGSKPLKINVGVVPVPESVRLRGIYEINGKTQLIYSKEKLTGLRVYYEYFIRELNVLDRETVGRAKLLFKSTIYKADWRSDFMLKHENMTELPEKMSFSIRYSPNKKYCVLIYPNLNEDNGKYTYSCIQFSNNIDKSKTIVLAKDVSRFSKLSELWPLFPKLFNSGDLCFFNYIKASKEERKKYSFINKMKAELIIFSDGSILKKILNFGKVDLLAGEWTIFREQLYFGGKARSREAKSEREYYVTGIYNLNSNEFEFGMVPITRADFTAYMKSKDRAKLIKNYKGIDDRVPVRLLMKDIKVDEHGIYLLFQRFRDISTEKVAVEAISVVKFLDIHDELPNVSFLPYSSSISCHECILIIEDRVGVDQTDVNWFIYGGASYVLLNLSKSSINKRYSNNEIPAKTTNNKGVNLFIAKLEPEKNYELNFIGHYNGFISAAWGTEVFLNEKIIRFTENVNNENGEYNLHDLAFELN